MDEIDFYLNSISLIVFIKISICINICNLATEACLSKQKMLNNRNPR